MDSGPNARKGVRNATARVPGAALLALAGSLVATPVAADLIRLPQAGGGELVLEAPAKRLVTLSPHLTELVFAAGAGHLLSATVEFSNFPAEAAQLPRVGDAFRIDTERVQLLDPDLVLGWQSGNPASALAHLAELGFALWSIEIRRPAEIAEVVEQIGKAAGTADLASHAAREMRRRLAGIAQTYAGRKAVRYFYQIAERPLYTVNGEHLISRGLALCGAENVFSNLTGLAPQIGREAVLVADPLALIAPRIEGAANPLEHWRAWPRLHAVRHENFLLLPADSISRATPRFLDAVELACTMLDDLRSQAPESL